MQRLTNKFWRILVALSLSCVAATSTFAQVPSFLQSPTPAAPKSNVPADPLGRETPRGAILGFIRAAQQEDYAVAIQYFQPPPRHHSSTEQEQELAIQLLTILNQKFGPFLDSVSRDPQGRLDDGLPRDEEKIGGIGGQSENFPIFLVRIEDQSERQLWFISRKTLDEVPRVYDSLRFPQIEKDLPKYLVENRPFAMPLWQWLAILLFFPVALLIAWVLIVLTREARKLIRRARGLPPLVTTRRVSVGVLLLAVLIHYNFVYLIGAPLLYRQYYTRFVWVLLAFGFYWLVTQFTQVASQRIGERLAKSGHMAERSIISLTRRVLDVLIFLLIGLVVLNTLGVNVTAALAGLGIGGLAIGLGAQKTFENLLGGISILSDKALVIGDPCRIGDQRGTVEDIGLRSTKIRTEDRTLVSIPNGTVATAVLENFRLRDKILSRQIVRLRYDLSPDHLRYALEQVREVLAQHPKVDAPTWRVRLLRFADYAFEVEIYFYVLERDYREFLAIQESILLEIMETLDRAGAAIALPSQTTIVTQDKWTDPEKLKTAQAAIEKSRDPGVPGPNNPAFAPDVEPSKES